MSKTRLEAFSDGVFAIVITLLILDIRLPQVPYDQLGATLLAATPKLVAYVLSFVIIGVYWVSHHHTAHRMARADGVIVWLNILLLLFVSFLPFPTSMLGSYPLQRLPIVLYGLNLLAANATGFGMILYLHLHPELLVPTERTRFLREMWPSYLWVNAAYLVAVLASIFHPLASYVIYGLTTMGVIVRLARVKITEAAAQ